MINSISDTCVDAEAHFGDGSERASNPVGKKTTVPIAILARYRSISILEIQQKITGKGLCLHHITDDLVTELIHISVSMPASGGGLDPRTPRWHAIAHYDSISLRYSLFQTSGSRVPNF